MQVSVNSNSHNKHSKHNPSQKNHTMVQETAEGASKKTIIAEAEGLSRGWVSENKSKQLS